MLPFRTCQVYGSQIASCLKWGDGLQNDEELQQGGQLMKELKTMAEKFNFDYYKKMRMT